MRTNSSAYTRAMRSLENLAVAVISLALTAATSACVPPPQQPFVNGSSLLIDVAPANRPAMIGQFDFDLLDAGVGKACVSRESDNLYWVGQSNVEGLSKDPLTQRAIAAAAFDAISRIEDADSIVFTSVSTSASGRNKVCATINGRGVHLKKAAGPSSPPEQTE